MDGLSLHESANAGKQVITTAMERIKTYTMADIEAERARCGVYKAAVCRHLGMDRQTYYNYMKTGNIPLARANAMLKFIYAKEKEQEREQARS